VSLDRQNRVLDTMTVSYLMKGDPYAVGRLEACSRTQVGIPQPVVGEIAFGLERMQKSKRKALLEARFRLILSEVLRVEWTDEVSLHFGSVKAFLERSGQPLEDFDIAIAAHALARDATLVSSNLQPMKRIPNLQLESWGPPA
jgi:tRNA(fMet)-specific endonuclease VapC